MNRFPVPSCGKFDFRDNLMLYTDGEDSKVRVFLEKTDVYVGMVGPLRLEKFEDCIPYFHYLISNAGISKEHNTFHLSEKSYLDSAEEENLRLLYTMILKEYKSHKRRLTWESFNNKLRVDKQTFNMIVEKIKNSNEIDLSGLHNAWAHRCRKNLLEYAEKNGADLNHPILLDIARKIEEGRYLENE